MTVGRIAPGTIPCIKCRGEDIYIRHHNCRHDCGYGDHGKPSGLECGGVNEHLHHYCRRCGWDWSSPTADRMEVVAK